MLLEISRMLRVMMLCMHESHNENEWDLEAPQKLACGMFKDLKGDFFLICRQWWGMTKIVLFNL